MMKISEMPKYDDYVDSGVEWLGRVPASWELTRLGTRFNERRSKVSDIDYPALSVTKKGVLPQLDNAAKTKDGDNRKLVKEGDFVINSRSDRKGSSGVSDRDGSVSLINIVLKPKGIHPKFSEHLLKSHAFIEEYYRVGRGIVADLWTTRYDEMRTITISVPSLEEQTRIANFLDKKTALIDEAISIKEKQISLLKERKQIIIQQAVTQGLDPNVPMKDSGVDWIGKIPAHWETVRSRWLFKQRREKARKEDEQLTASQKYGVISQQQYMELEGRRVTQVEFNSEILKHVEANDFVISMRSFQGGIEFCPYTGCVSSAYVPLIPNSMVYAPYFKHLLKSSRYIEALQSTSNLVRDGQALRYENFCMVDLLIVPEEEQVAIAKYIDDQNSLSEMSTILLEAQIERLKEYKTTLINSAVTGKIKITPEMVEQ
ncbi:restriction endonuclease subunit S [Escherichia coli]|uniref:restriction endonuclease subunit S n=1 Tax=Escherichia coli TaxID=562 RepID=UPI001CA407C0|nr:restriction endonuclease subunit S [Escherichia coli]MBY8596478.1 restriction endonuclease subunit S [Escherichia coli]HCJ9370706.1 restriction endonuclease subunit S [Escherichia coli]